MATVPISGTSIRFLSDVPFSNDYKNTRWFDTESAQTAYFLSKPEVHYMNEYNFQRIETKHIIAVNKSIDALWGTNYIMFQNAEYNDKWFYAFVTKLEYVQKGTTHVHFEIDVFQTWKFSMNFKPSFVIREHRPQYNDNGSPVVNTVDEGLDFGSEYENAYVENYLPSGNVLFLVIVSKALMHGTDANKITPVLNGMPQPLSYYIHPFFVDGSTPSSNFTLSPILKVLKGLYTQDDAVNNIVSLYVTDYIGEDIHDGDDTLTFNESKFKQVSIADDANENFTTVYAESLPSYAPKYKSFGNKYDGYKPVSESKLLMYPYTVLVLDDFKGNRKEYKNEYINSQDIEIWIRGSMGTSNKIAYGIKDYNTYLMTGNITEAIVSLESALINNNPNDIPILNDYLSAYLQGNRNSIENQKASILFNGQMGIVGNGIGLASSGASGNIAGVASSSAGMLQGAGSTVLQLQGIEAKKQDISNTPPSLAKMGSNTNFDFGNGFKGVYLFKKQIKREYITKLEHFFNMFGYKTNEVKVPNFHTRKYWNYVQTSSCVILGDFNHEDLNALKAVFDNGITLWHTDDVGNYSLDNGVI